MIAAEGWTRLTGLPLWQLKFFPTIVLCARVGSGRWTRWQRTISISWFSVASQRPVHLWCAATVGCRDLTIWHDMCAGARLAQYMG